MAEFKQTDLSFPLRGIDLQWEFGDQPGLTTRLGKNVRAYEPSSDRARGGSRSGLVRYLPQVPAGANLIQHLEMIVDPQAPFTGLSFDADTDTPIFDTSDGGRAVLDDGSTRIIRQGGSGYYTHPEAEQEGDQPVGSIYLRQKKAGDVTGGNTDFTFDSEFAGNPASTVIVVTESAGSVGQDFDCEVRDSATPYTLIGKFTASSGLLTATSDGPIQTEKYVVRVWRARTNNNVVTVVDSGEVATTVLAMEWRRISDSVGAGNLNEIIESVEVNRPEDGGTIPDPQSLSVPISVTKQMILVCWIINGSGGHALPGWATPDLGEFTVIPPTGTSFVATKVLWAESLTPPSADFTFTHGDPNTVWGNEDFRAGMAAVGIGFSWTNDND